MIGYEALTPLSFSDENLETASHHPCYTHLKELLVGLHKMLFTKDAYRYHLQ